MHAQGTRMATRYRASMKPHLVHPPIARTFMVRFSPRTQLDREDLKGARALRYQLARLEAAVACPHCPSVGPCPLRGRCEGVVSPAAEHTRQLKKSETSQLVPAETPQSVFSMNSRRTSASNRSGSAERCIEFMADRAIILGCEGIFRPSNSFMA